MENQEVDSLKAACCIVNTNGMITVGKKQSGLSQKKEGFNTYQKEKIPFFS